MATRDPAGVGSYLDPKRAGILVDEHRRVGRLLDRVREAAQGSGGEELTQAWDLLERAIEEHLSLEEKELMPRFRNAFPRVAERVLAEHAAIRTAVRELAVQVELRSIQMERIETLARLLTEHASGERRDFYPALERRLMTWVWARVLRATNAGHAQR